MPREKWSRGLYREVNEKLKFDEI